MEFPSMAFTEKCLCEKVTNAEFYYTSSKVTKVNFKSKPSSYYTSKDVSALSGCKDWHDA
jgi:hypothetical protein